MPEAEILVIGGGIAGVAVAYHLSALGRRVVLIERDHVAAHASGVNNGAISAAPQRPGEDLEAVLATGSLEIFRSLQLDMGHAIEFRQSGALRAIATAEEMMLARAIASSAPGPAGPVLLDGREARAIEPWLSPGLLGALHSPRNGHAHPAKATRALAEAARRLGCRIETGRAVTAMAARGDGSWRVAAAPAPEGGREIVAGKVVLAAGAWSAALGAMLGLDIPIVPVRGQMWSTPRLPPRVFHNISAMESALHWRRRPAEGDQPPALTHRGRDRVTRHLYGRQTADGAVIFGGDRALVGATTATDPEGIAVNHGQAAEILPFLAGIPIERRWAGLMPFSSDGRPLIGAIPSRPNLYICSGMASSGFGEGPMAGKLLAEAIHSGTASPILAEADPARCVRG